jgi:5-methylcytosine-specific restriction endonuclease McrA
MSGDFGKRPRLRLDPERYRQLKMKILQRDGWECQACGSLAGLEIHHIQRRSQSGDDSEGNLITLCSDCHRAMHASCMPDSFITP